MQVDKFKVPASMLSPAVDPERLGFDDTSELEPLTETIGQNRAVEALEFGLQMKSTGFNIYVSGPVGTGKGTLVRQMVKRLAQSSPAPSDWCYVNNSRTGVWTVLHLCRYAVGAIEEAIELLTGVPAGDSGLDGLYSTDTVYGVWSQCQTIGRNGPGRGRVGRSRGKT